MNLQRWLGWNTRLGWYHRLNGWSYLSWSSRLSWWSSHGASLTEVGIYGAVFGGLSGVAGTLSAGVVMLRLHRRDSRWELWLPGLCYALALPCYAASFALPEIAQALASQFCAVFLAAAGGTVAISAIQSFAEPHRRATAVAVMVLLSSLIGLGLGPAAVGATSDALADALGTQSLRYALILSTAFFVWAALHFVAAARAITSQPDIGAKYATA
jgi:hypothetical protein